MSDKIKSKELSYDAALPPFLQRLKGQHTGRGDADRHERPLARPRKAKDNDGEDGPVVVDEHGDTITEKDLEQRNAAEKAKLDDAVISKEYDVAYAQRADKTVTNGLATNKRKAAKIVADDEPDVDKTAAIAESSTPIKKVKKKAKAIKLAFDDEDGSACTAQTLYDLSSISTLSQQLCELLQLLDGRATGSGCRNMQKRTRPKLVLPSNLDAAVSVSGQDHVSALAQSTYDEALSANLANNNTTPNTPRSSWLARVSQRASHIPKTTNARPRDTLPLRSAGLPRKAGSSDRLITTVLSPAFQPAATFSHSPASPASPADTDFGVTPIDATFGDRVVTPPRKTAKAEVGDDMNKYSKQAGDASYDSDADADDEFERSMVGSPGLIKDYAADESDHPSDSEEEHESVDGEDTPTTQGWTNAKNSVSEWSSDDVADFVVSLAPQMKTYRDSFIEEEINGEALVALQHDELRELGISSVGHRLTILKAVYGQKIKSGVKILDGDYVPLSAEGDKGDEAATQDDISRIIESIHIRDQRIIAAEEQLRALRADLERIMDDNRKLREETLPAVRLMKDQRTPLPDPNGGTIPSPREIDIVKSEPGSAGLPKEKQGSSLSRKFSTKKIFLGGAPKLSPTHPSHPSIRDDGGAHLEASAAAMAASTHLTASMTSQPSPSGISSQPLSPASPAYSAQPSSGGSYHPPAATFRSTSRPHHEDTGTATTSWASNSTLVDNQNTLRQNRMTRQAPTPSPREDEAPGGSRESKDHGVEIFKSFRVSIEDPCEVVLPVALKRYQIHDDWRQYSLYIVHGDQERCLGLKEKPLMLFKQLDKEGRKPMFMLRRHATPQTGWTGSVGGSTVDRNIPGGVL